MRKVGLVFMALILLSTFSYALAEANIDPDKIHFYMYGAKTCPHCRKMKEEIPKAYGEDSFTYYELINNEENQALFGEQYKYTGIAGVPAIGIAYEGQLVAIVEGEYNVSATPKIIEAALENEGLILVMGGQAYIIKNESVIQKLQLIYVEHRMPEVETTSSAQPNGSENENVASPSQTSNGVCGPGIFALLAVLPLMFWRRRR